MSQVKQYADKVRAIDDEIASMRAMMQECGGGGGCSSLRNMGKVTLQSSADKSAEGRPKHMRTLPGPSKLDRWRRSMPTTDENAVEKLLKQCEKWVGLNGGNPPGNLYNLQTTKTLRTLALTGQSISDAYILKNQGTLRTSQNDLYPAVPNVYYPNIAYHINESPNPIGFEFLQYKMNAKHTAEWSPDADLPTMYDEEGTYYTFFSFTMPAMLIQNLVTGDRPNPNIHIICKGFREFNSEDKLPVDTKGEAMIWYVDTDDVNNLDVFAQSVVACESFQEAAKFKDDNKLRRIVVWMLLKGHFEAFCWDQLYDSEGVAIKDILFIMSTMPQNEFELDEAIHQHIITAFKKVMMSNHYISQNAQEIPDLACQPNLQISIRKQPADVACVLFTTFATLLLCTVQDIEKWDGKQIDNRFWDYCRAGYAKFEQKLVVQLQTLIASGHAIWISPELQKKHVNIKEVYLITVDTEGVKRKMVYNWTTGWVISAIPQPAS